MNDKKKVFVGVSGGVDSSVSLALLQKQNYDVTGVFLKVWSPDFLECDWREERRSAMRVCATLGVPFMTIDCEKEYKKEVVDYMIREYSVGRVPNPDVFCNKFIKFGVFLKKAKELGADFIATGHYARIEAGSMKQEARKSFQDSQLITHNSLLTTHYLLLESIDKNKDQSYFLYTLNQEQLNHTLFPVGDLTKPEVRELAKKYGLSTAEKKDSQGLCFIGKIDMKVFLSHYIKTARGDVLNTSGEVIGWHPGSVLFAIGERHGFTITKKTSNDPRFFVIAKNLSLNTITVADKESETDETNGIKEVKLDKIHFLSGIMPTLPLKTTARVRYRQEKQECMILKESDGYRVYFNKPQDGVSAGQSIVFYDGELCLGGGIIEFA